jgi:general secretion pathway protein A
MPHTRDDLTAVSAGGRTSLLTYEPYYGLKEKPFSLSSDPRFLFKSPSHAPVHDSLHAAICRGEGLMVLTGDSGTGKTMLCRSVLGGLDCKTLTAFVSDPFVSREDLLKRLLTDFGVAVSGDATNGRASAGSRLELSYPLHDFLRTLKPLDTIAVVVIDQAQNLSQSVLEELRVLSDLDGPEKLLQVVLIGPAELQTTLNDPRMRQLDQRVSLRCHLEPLDDDSVRGYMMHRLNVASGHRHRVTFSEEAVAAICRGSSGNPRLVNLICDRSLHYGHLSRTLTISDAIVAQALSELGMAPPVVPSDPMAAFTSEGDTGAGSDCDAGAPDPLGGEFPSETIDDGAVPVAAPVAESKRRFRLLYWAAVGLGSLLVTAVLLFA